MDKKTVLRARFKEARKLIDTKKISDKIVENIKISAIYQDAKHVMIFYPLKYEINLLPLLLLLSLPVHTNLHPVFLQIPTRIHDEHPILVHPVNITVPSRVAITTEFAGAVRST